MSRESKAHLQAHYGSRRKGEAQKGCSEQGNWKWKLEAEIGSFQAGAGHYSLHYGEVLLRGVSCLHFLSDLSYRLPKYPKGFQRPLFLTPCSNLIFTGHLKFLKPGPVYVGSHLHNPRVSTAYLVVPRGWVRPVLSISETPLRQSLEHANTKCSLNACCVKNVSLSPLPRTCDNFGDSH